MLANQNYLEVDIPPIDNTDKNYFFNALIENLPTSLIVMGSLLALALISFLITKFSKKEIFINAAILLTVSSIVIPAFITLSSSLYKSTLEPYSATIKRIEKIKENSYQNIITKYKLDEIPKENFVYWPNEDNQPYSRVLDTVSVSYSDLESETVYNLTFDFKDNEPILLKSENVNEDLIKSLEK